MYCAMVNYISSGWGYSSGDPLDGSNAVFHGVLKKKAGVIQIPSFYLLCDNMSCKGQETQRKQTPKS